MTPNDRVLSAIRAAVLEAPDDDTLRLIFADRLHELGESAAAVRIREQVTYPNRTRQITGPEVGIPIALTASFRRGFAWGLTVPHAELGRIGEALRDHPIEVISVDGSSQQLLIEYTVSSDDRDDEHAPKQWVASIVSEFPRPGQPLYMVSRTWTWRRREDMVAAIGGWAAEHIRPPRDWSPFFDDLLMPTA